jgi:two-component system, OmpR family, sensor kinase
MKRFHPRAMMRLPIRVRLTLAFSVVMALVLCATGVFVYLRLDSELDQALNEGLRGQADRLTALVRASDSALGSGQQLSDRDDSFAQVLDTQGNIVDASPQTRRQPLLSRTEATRASRGTIFLDRDRVPGADEPVRLLATPMTVRGERRLLVAGASNENDEALATLLTQLLVGGPLALVLASLAGYALAAAALRPVESMRSEAASISVSRPGQRLSVPEPEDEIARLGQTLNAMLDRLEAAIARERRFVADASHELRTPLSLMKTELEIALRRPRSADELTESLRSAAEETERLVQLAESLLVLARADQGQLAVRLGPHRVDEILGDVVRRFSPRATQRGRLIEHEAPAGLRITADRLHVERALGNLVDNALRHGGGAVRLFASHVNGRVELHVTDEGRGFPPAYLDRAFERFSSADEAHSAGTGLGLAIVDVIARAHGGLAGAANRDGAGADVWLSLPSEGAVRLRRGDGRDRADVPPS